MHPPWSRIRQRVFDKHAAVCLSKLTPSCFSERTSHQLRFSFSFFQGYVFGELARAKWHQRAASPLQALATKPLWMPWLVLGSRSSTLPLCTQAAVPAAVKSDAGRFIRTKSGQLSYRLDNVNEVNKSAPHRPTRGRFGGPTEWPIGHLIPPPPKGLHYR
ncbi:hypothetical protein GOP47_0007025 [Adiantum capillus-veneris]|uniref:Uncharacterized protein n=1 Tax=Adiantum capillus-veneris TaxID=13818 RepID=A0A9D4ZL46_ADICA|nr:hypothetical protein GOP47_0007025 [Adiantum capillus-veneris]